MKGTFSLYEQTKVANKELIIIYKPNVSTLEYSYKVYKDNKVYSELTVKNNKMSSIHLGESGTYKIEINGIDKNKKTFKETSGIYNIDIDKPVMAVQDNIFIMEKLKKGDTLKMADLKGYLTVIDKQDGDLFNKTTCDFTNIDFSKQGLYNLKCSVKDNANNYTEATFKFNITKSNSTAINTVQSLLIIFLAIVIALLIRYMKVLNIEKKIANYSIDSINNKKISPYRRFKDVYNMMIEKLSKILSRSTFVKDLAVKYDKYQPLYRDLYKDSIQFISFKVILSLIFILITLVSKTIQLKILNFYEILIPLAFGFILPDIVYLIKYKWYRNKIENDLLQAIIVMNNAFKSGRSIIQAIDLVTHELDGPISEEFKKMSLELNFGLSIETVFSRFSERIKLEEVTYLTATLTILNKTGGNIIKVFSSIEKTMFNKKRLNLEMQSLIGSSKIVIWILSLAPIMFILLISFISPTYFEPLFTSNLGYILTIIMIFIYIIYIYVIRKIMKVRM